MRTLLFVVSALAVMGLAFWAYSENYRTQAELAEVRTLQGEIGQLRESLSVLRAEWAYLNRPDRLRELVDLNFERLGLLPLEPQQFISVEQVSYPLIVQPSLVEPVDVVATIETVELTN